MTQKPFEPTHQVLVPAAYVKNGRVVRLRRPGAEVELDDDAVAQLGAKVRPLKRLREQKTKPAPTQRPDTPPPPDDVTSDGDE